MLQVSPELTPAEVKAALLLGADWQGPVPCSSVQYEMNNDTDDCSYARQPDDRTDADSLGILNNVGFGILDAAESLRYVHQSSSHVISDHLADDHDVKRYRITIADSTEPVKVILTWLKHPHGGIDEQDTRTAAVNVANLDFAVACPTLGTFRADSANQTAEFAVFASDRSETCTITVSGTGVGSINKPVQNYALASTHQLDPVQPSNRAPVATPQTVIVSPGMEKTIRLYANDLDGDSVSFHVSRDPAKGVITTDEFITSGVSRAVYTPDADFAGTDTFEVRPHDGNMLGAAAQITLRAENLPAGSSGGNVTADIRDWSYHNVTSGFSQSPRSMTFDGPGYAVSAIRLGSSNMEGAEAQMTAGSDTYRIAVPESGDRQIVFASPIRIDSVVLSAQGIEEEAASQNRMQDVFVRIGYEAGDACPGTGPGAPGAQCPTSSSTYRHTSHASVPIPDDTGRQDASNTITVPPSSAGAIISLSVSVDISHTYIGDLKVTLTSPGGTEVTLHERKGGDGNNIQATYDAVSHPGLRSLSGQELGGAWTISVGDYERGDVGRINAWTINATFAPGARAPLVPGGAVIFSDDFESYPLHRWTETGGGDWRISFSQTHEVPILPDRDGSNKVLHSDACGTSCIMTTADAIDLAEHQSAVLSFWRFVDPGLDGDEYLKVEIYDGSRWTEIYHWSDNLGGDDGMWHHEVYDLSSYLLASEFKLRFVTQQSHPLEDVQVDEVLISAGSTAPQSSVSEFSEDFQTDLSEWVLSGDSRWHAVSPSQEVAGDPNRALNRVLWSYNCDWWCIAQIEHPVDTTAPRDISFDRFVSNTMDGNEGLYVQYSTSGQAWTDLASYTANNQEHTHRWEAETVRLDIAEDQAYVRFSALSAYYDEYVEFDNVRITTSGPNTPPTIATIPDTDVEYDAHRTIDVLASDADGDSIAITLRSPPDFVTITDRGSGRATISVSPDPSDLGLHVVTVAATAGSKTHTESFVITVTAPNQPPTAAMTLSHQSIVVNSRIPMPFITADCSESTDPEGDALTYGWASDPPISGVAGDSASITFKPSRGPSYTHTYYTITCTISDGTSTDSSAKVLSIYSGGSSGLGG